MKDTNHNKVEIIDFTNDLKDHIKILNYEWLNKYFRVEKRDELSLSNPKEEIIDKGGMIFYAKLNNEIVGTASLIKKSNQVFELGKMAVASNAQGFRIGTLLLEHCLDILKENNVEKCILYSNTKLESAIHLYRKYGFLEIELESGIYERANIKMEKIL
ncbi:GNAT family N-acetyltransferase [Flavobacterium sp.]|uniref:GNAT family N-acetyltransferase n=1 Tax=Flavobacterium sp. TaxID=239 RepID=UPI0037531DB4